MFDCKPSFLRAFLLLGFAICRYATLHDMQKTHCIGIAGGSGSGKSTLAVALAKKYPDQIAILHLDDYGAKKEHIPMLNGFLNREHPDAIRFDDLHRDLHALQSGRAITVRTKSELYNPSYTLEEDNKIEYTIEPKHIIIVEGYLVFHDARIRDLMDKKIYLDMPIEESLQRRTKFRDEEYFKKVLVPMHHQYIEPTKQYADVVIDVSTMNIDDMMAIAEQAVTPFLD